MHLQACHFLLDQLHQDHPHTTFHDGRLRCKTQGKVQLGLLGRQDLANSEVVRAVLESPHLATLVGNLLQVSCQIGSSKNCISFDPKLRLIQDNDAELLSLQSSRDLA